MARGARAGGLESLPAEIRVHAELVGLARRMWESVSHTAQAGALHSQEAAEVVVELHRRPCQRGRDVAL